MNIDMQNVNGYTYYKLSDFGRSIGLSNPRREALRYVSDQNKITFGNHHATYINELGAEELRTKKKTKVPVLWKTFVMNKEYQLHNRIVAFIRGRWPDWTIVPGLGELQETQTQRFMSKKKGYLKGQSDLIITHPGYGYGRFKGLCIELKAPSTNDGATPHQLAFLERMGKAGFYCMVTNKYEDLILTLYEYSQKISPIYNVDRTDTMETA